LHEAAGPHPAHRLGREAALLPHDGE
jgi:hypothetical protein